MVFQLKSSDCLITLLDGRVHFNMRSDKSHKPASKKKKGISVRQWVFKPSVFDYELILKDCKPYSEAVFEDLYDNFFDFNSHGEAKYLPIKKKNKRSLLLIMAYFLQLDNNDFTSYRI